EGTRIEFAGLQATITVVIDYRPCRYCGIDYYSLIAIEGEVNREEQSWNDQDLGSSNIDMHTESALVLGRSQYYLSAYSGKWNDGPQRSRFERRQAIWRRRHPG